MASFTLPALHKGAFSTSSPAFVQSVFLLTDILTQMR